MKVTELLLFGVAGWCGIGLVGIAISLARGRRAEAVKHSASIAMVAGIYLLLVLAVSLAQRQRVVAMGQDQCFDVMCFAVVAVDEVPGLVAGDDGRVVRATIRVANHGRQAQAEGSISAYVVDSRGRIWVPLPGLSGNRLNGRVAGGSEMVSQPMFRIAKDSEGLGLVLTHGSWQPGRLVIGDSDSLGHRRTVVALGR
jgi:hypothetical protein